MKAVADASPANAGAAAARAAQAAAKVRLRRVNMGPGPIPICRAPAGRAGRGERSGPDAITLRQCSFGNHSRLYRIMPDGPVQADCPRTYWSNHSMVRVHACWAAALL